MQKHEFDASEGATPRESGKGPVSTRTILLGGLSLALAVGWISRERALANESARLK